jgi:hypothetical protein
MASLSAVQGHVAGAGSLPELLDAACEAFEAMLTVIRQHDMPDTEMFVPMVLAGASAGNGRDSILFAPSLPPRRLQPDTAAEDGQRPMAGRAAADWLTHLCDVLASRLTEAAASADAPGDRQACVDAASCAREIHALMGDGQP